MPAIVGWFQRIENDRQLQGRNDLWLERREENCVLHLCPEGMRVIAGRIQGDIWQRTRLGNLVPARLSNFGDASVSRAMFEFPQ